MGSNSVQPSPNNPIEPPRVAPSDRAAPPDHAAAAGPPSPADRAAIQDRIRRNQGLVRTIAWQIWHKLGRRVELEELIAYGNVGLAQAAGRYDAEQGQFSTFVWRRIRGAIYDGLAEMAWFDAAKFEGNRYESGSRAVLESDTGIDADRDASPAQDAAWLADAASRLAIVHLLSMDGDAQPESAVADPTAEMPPEMAELSEERALLADALERLPRQERELIQAVYFEGESLASAGRRLGMSKATATRRHSEVLRTLFKAICPGMAETAG